MAQLQWCGMSNGLVKVKINGSTLLVLQTTLGLFSQWLLRLFSFNTFPEMRASLDAKTILEN